MSVTALLERFGISAEQVSEVAELYRLPDDTALWDMEVQPEDFCGIVAYNDFRCITYDNYDDLPWGTNRNAVKEAMRNGVWYKGMRWDRI